jgi:uncharacterized membrane protein YqiK
MSLDLILMIVGGSILAIFLLIALVSSILNVGGKEVKALERRWFGKKMPSNRVFAMKGEIGIQARVKGPGLYLLPPFIYKRRSYPFIVIGNDEIGVVQSNDGNPVPSGKIFARPVECDLFQDGEAFLRNGGEKGIQLAILPPGGNSSERGYNSGGYRLNPLLFTVKTVKQTVIKEDEVGIVESVDGTPVPAGRIFGKVVESDLFQDAAAFLANGGEKGPQIQTLPPGTFRINPAMFKVTPVKITVIEKGQVGIVTSQDGQPISN